MGRTVFIDTDVVTSQLNSLPTNRFSFGFICGQSTKSERDYIHYAIDGITSKQADINSFFESSSTNKELWAKIIEITSSLCAGISIIGFYCRAKNDLLKSTNFTLKIRRLFDILQSAARIYSPWSLIQSSHRILLQSELGNGANKWLVKTMDMSSDTVNFRPVEMKTYDSKANSMWCMTTTIPIQFNVWLNSIENKNDNSMKLFETQFEQQWKQYTDNLKESLLLMDDRLLSLNSLKLSSKTSENSVDIQWLSPIDSITSNEYSDENRICYKFDGGVSLRFVTCSSDTTGNDIRQYFIEDLFRSILIRLNLALINNESNNAENISINKLILPRRIYVNQPVFISAYQLIDEPLSTVIDSLQENFKITSVMEDDLEAAEEFPPEITNDERLKQFNTNINQDTTHETSTVPKSIYQFALTFIEKQFGTGNTILIVLIISILILLISMMIKLFT
ncbi:unnamed protein product [Rotaria magnacalcarata]|uniref:Protein odr-4 homolog n=1 Tax=Rotaria magnacalcarata TaxID=392030 RepID=A0A816SCI1_9BILA|nr:unnamed protein product [Rotaria magnacalcarata]CAF1593902.1 unnamed protein product [Rotaria magnacalcarata]CAF2082160.1 unnamed protein product [Rotaria magnacalcarata]CAF3744741.1 unnamed protein product [Rotaria magnacalcarata]CAF3859689.1 unnamed protein product [Rotaria magnacalcarata]